ncbi:uncharacterized protein J4E88_006871 [Alternaria novae-zelandiae]|uniref:uncharacterized protein n=1 Tax=Alternaria novae-zelandiae TaxID=430562 RepID=UPI0020C22E94|nr:uncharacterized protein J4E88_006871 [Alternaria novae-zelandiae]KAI4677064.1 hypothetical protein J4E88_006871 [Alternaria novae-zelandiae]
METSTSRIVLVVPKQHVKTVKSALERAGQFDRNSKIVPDLDSERVSSAVGNSTGPTQSADLSRSSPPEADTAASPAEASHAPPNLTQQSRFPRLHFDATRGEYVDQSSLEDRTQRGSQIVENETSSPAGESPGDRDSHIRFPTLQFDVVRGEYVERSTVNTEADKAREPDQNRMRIPTTIPCPAPRNSSNDILDAEGLKSKITEDLALSEISTDISISHHVPSTAASPRAAHSSPLHKALGTALTLLLDLASVSHTLTVEALVTAFPDGYSVYKPMLLLPHNALSSAPWRALSTTYPADSDEMKAVWRDTAISVGATHVAINAPIPISTSSTSASLSTTAGEENILRSPTNLTPLYGNFGPAPTSQTITSPSATDFADALWVTARQNGIWQTWAPLYTMFSRGNVNEKARILNLASVNNLDVASTAVDLYAGIGYFAFSYKKSGDRRDTGIKQVACWEINPWSVEGLRRGAEMNGWTCRVLKDTDIAQLRESPSRDDSCLDQADLLVFQTSNESAETDYALLPSPKPPVRHVNLGLLPSSKLSWGVAVAMLDKQLGGWIHVHENVGVKDVETRRKVIEEEFQSLVDKRDAATRRKVLVEHVEKVKMYAPGVVHCVFDVVIGGDI